MLPGSIRWVPLTRSTSEPLTDDDGTSLRRSYACDSGHLGSRRRPSGGNGLEEAVDLGFQARRDRLDGGRGVLHAPGHGRRAA